LLWTGQTASTLDNGAFRTAIAWQVLILTHSGAAMGAILIASTLPQIVFILIGGLAADRLPRRGFIFFLSDLIAGATLLTFAAPLPRATEPFVVIAAAVVMGVGLSLGQTIWVTLLHRLVPNDKLGRVSSIDLLGSMALLPIGYALAGVLTDSSGPRSVFVAGGTLCVLLNIIPLFLRAIRELD